MLHPTTTLWMRSSPSVAAEAAKAAATTGQKPLERLANASAKCRDVGRIYAKCVHEAQFAKEGSGVHKGLCEAEFQAFKQCVQQQVGRKW